MPSYPRYANRETGPMGCPVDLDDVDLDDVDLFGDGAQEHWYDAYEILHREAPVHRLPGEGLTPGSDAFVLTKHADVLQVVKDPERFPPTTASRIAKLAEQGLSGEELFAASNSLMATSMATLRPTQELYFQHRKELTDPGVGTGALRHREMMTQHADVLIDEWINDGGAAGDDFEIEFISRFARPLPQRVMATILGFSR